MSADRERIEAVIRACIEARARLGGHGAFRIRVLLDMILIELEKELAVLLGSSAPPARH